MYYYKKDDYLMHHGIKGQKWGVRRYQNEDGSLTKEGLARYSSDRKWAKNALKQLNSREKEAVKNYGDANRYNKKVAKYVKKANEAYEKGNAKKNEKYSNKAKEFATMRDEHEKRVKELDSMNWKTTAELLSKGFDVSITNKNFKYGTAKGKTLAIGLGIIGSAAATNMGDLAVVAGKKYSANWSKDNQSKLYLEADEKRFR